jgi:uncharacterized OB-fold protein
VTANPMAKRPRTVVNVDNAFFWEGVAERRLLIQRCADCGLLRHPPRPMCGACQSTEWDTLEASGRGTLFSFVVHHHPPLPGVTAPHLVGVIELEEGTRFVAELVEVEPADVAIGMPMWLRWVQMDDELTLPLFGPTDPGRATHSPSEVGA